MGQATNRSSNETLNLVITNALIVDWSGIYKVSGNLYGYQNSVFTDFDSKADIGVKDGMIVGIGKAGNPDVMDGVDPKLIVGSSTEAIAEQLAVVVRVSANGSPSCTLAKSEIGTEARALRRIRPTPTISQRLQ